MQIRMTLSKIFGVTDIEAEGFCHWHLYRVIYCFYRCYSSLPARRQGEFTAVR